jgi:DNA polymerase-1
MDAVTGRIASYDIQMHNLPTGARLGDIVPSAGPIRRVFIPDEGTFTRFDLGQIELRVLAYLSGDVRMTEILSLPKDEGGDMHLNTMKVLGIYSKVMAKNFNFGTMFGGDVETLAKFTGINDLNLLRQYQYQMRLEYPQLFTWIDQQRRDGLRNMSVETIYGRTLRLDQSKNPNELSEKHIMNCAVNYPVQGSAAEIFKRLRIACLQYIPLDKYVLQVHDEQLFDSDHSLPKEELEHLAPFWTPMDISIVNRWQ